MPTLSSTHYILYIQQVGHLQKPVYFEQFASYNGTKIGEKTGPPKNHSNVGHGTEKLKNGVTCSAHLVQVGTVTSPTFGLWGSRWALDVLQWPQTRTFDFKTSIPLAF